MKTNIYLNVGGCEITDSETSTNKFFIAPEESHFSFGGFEGIAEIIQAASSIRINRARVDFIGAPGIMPGLATIQKGVSPITYVDISGSIFQVAASGQGRHVQIHLPKYEEWFSVDHVFPALTANEVQQRINSGMTELEAVTTNIILQQLTNSPVEMQPYKFLATWDGRNIQDVYKETTAEAVITLEIEFVGV